MIFDADIWHGGTSGHISWVKFVGKVTD